MRLPNNILILLTVSLALFMDVLDSNIINTAIPVMSESLQVSPVDLKIALISYLLSLAIFIPISGWAADRYGTKRVFIYALSLFTLSSVACGFSTTLLQLIIARSIQGIGGAFMLALGRLIVAQTFERHRLVQAMNTVVIVVSVGVMIGPYIGGFITDHFSWPWIFWVNIPAGIIAILLTSYSLKDQVQKNPRPFDALGFILFGGSLAILCYALSELSETDIDYFRSIIMISISTMMLITYFFHAKRHPFPVIKTKLFEIRTFRISVLGNLFARLGFGGAPFLLPLLFQIGLGYSPELSGLLLIPMAFGIIFSKLFGFKLLKLLNYKRYLLLNTVLVGASLWLFMFINTHSSLYMIAAMVFLYGIFITAQYTAMNSLALADVPTEEFSFSNSITSTIQILGQSLGVAMGAILLRIFSALAHEPLLLTPTVFHHVFLTLGILTCLSTFIFAGLEADDGQQMLRIKNT